MGKLRLVPAVLAGLCAAVLGVTACSSNSSSSTGASTSPTGASSAAVQGISGTTIKIGGISESTDYAGTEQGFQARIDRANKDHELGKYTIQLVGTQDDGQSPATDLTDAQNLVERQGVYAVAPVVTSGFSSTTASFLQGKGIPYFGAGFSDGFCLPYTQGLSAVGCAVGSTYSSDFAVPLIAQALGKPASQLTFAIVGLDIPQGTQTDASYADAVKLAGGKVVYNQAVVPLTTGNLGPVVNAVEAAKPDVVWILAGGQALAVKGAFKASGYTGALVDDASYAPGLLKESPAVAAALNGTYVLTTSPVLEQNTPFVKQMVSDFTAAGISSKDITFGGEYGYMTADDMIALLKKIAPNFGSVASTLKSGFSYSPATGGTPLNYPFMFQAPPACGSLVKVVNGVYTTAAPFSCSTSYFSLNGSLKATAEPSPAG